MKATRLKLHAYLSCSTYFQSRLRQTPAAFVIVKFMATWLVMTGAVSGSLASGITVNDLRCEYRHDPLGVDILKPRLSWILNSDQRGAKQSAYELLISSNPELLSRNKGDLWDSGKINSSQTNQIEYVGQPLASRARCFWKTRAWDGKGEPSEWSAPSMWTMGLLSPTDWQAKWVTMDGEMATPRYFRKPFKVSRSIRRATVYATALGLYELRLNGQRVGDQLLAPEWTAYQKRVQYQTYDVTPQIKQGDNAIGAILGNGWYDGNWQFWGRKLQPINKTDPYLLVQLEIEYADGNRQMVVTDNSWQGTLNGPLRFSGIYEGETYDARIEMPGWDTSEFKDESWSPAMEASPQAGPLVWQRSEPIRVEQELKPVAVREPQPGVYVFDLGQNMAGWCRLHLNEPQGTQLTLQLNEVLNPDGTVYMDNLHAGHMSRGDRQVIHYTCRGGGEVYEPHFTYQGFRYVRIAGLTTKPSLELLTGCVFHTSFTQTGSFTCSNDLLNRLMLNIQWSQRANMMGVPTDCCQRDERCGYTGDMNFFMPTAVYNFDIAAFASKWLVDVCEDSQRPGGWFADHAPYYGPGGGPNVGWSDAGIICPYVIWRAYGDTRVIRDHYAAMQRNLGWLKSISKDFLHTDKIGNGDWLNLGGGAAKDVIGTAYDGYDFRLMAEMARAIGQEQDARDYDGRANAITDAFSQAFIDCDGKIRGSSQTGFALAFTMGLVPPDLKQRMSDQFAIEIARYQDHLATGFIGTPRLLPGLHLAGRDDLAYKLLLNDTYPSWLYEVKNGATTIWERWNGYTPGKPFTHSGMNSFNHYAFGAVGEYMYGMVGGIQPASPGYKTVSISPVIRDGLSWANTRYDSIQGRIVSNWKLNSGMITLDILIPPNTTATVSIPAKSPDSVREGDNSAGNSEGVKLLRLEQGAIAYTVESGRYHFTSNLLLRDGKSGGTE